MHVFIYQSTERIQSEKDKKKKKRWSNTESKKLSCNDYEVSYRTFFFA